MRLFVIKELKNNLYLADLSATENIAKARIYDNIKQAIEDKRDAIWDFVHFLGYDVELLGLDEYNKLRKELNIKVIPIEIIEGCYIE